VAKRPSSTKGKTVSEMAAAFATGAAAADEGASPPRSPDRAHRAAATAAAAAPKEVTLDRSSGLGLVLVEDDDSDGTTVVYDFVPLADGSEGPGFRCGRIGVGDSLVAVQGRPMAGITHDDVLACIAAAPTLVTLAFQAPGGGSGGGGGGGGSQPGECAVVSPGALLAMSPVSALHSAAYAKRRTLVAARRAKGFAVPLLYTSTTKASRKMEYDERWLMQLLDGQNMGYEVLFVDVGEEGARRRAEVDASRLLPQVHVGGKCVGDAADVQALVDEGVFQQVMHRTSARC